jgi:hypothetical protein
MTNFSASSWSANEQMKSASKVDSKLHALDGLDPLALNPNGWFAELLLDRLTAARVAIIHDRWNDAVVRLNQTANAMEEFVDVVKKGPEALADTTKSAALELANAERSQCAHVQAFVGKKSAGLL